MKKSIGVLPKKRGRPATGRDPMLNFRSPPDLTARIDAWVDQQSEPRPSRSEAIRQLVEKSLASESSGTTLRQSNASLDHKIEKQETAIAQMHQHSEPSPEASVAAMDKAMKNKTRRKNAKQK
jgi:Arc/MetJ-type ribon-helix-helix transcriptional regulator